MTVENIPPPAGEAPRKSAPAGTRSRPLAAGQGSGVGNRGTGTKRKTLEHLPSARRLTGQQAEARSRLVRRLRFIMPGIAVALIALFLLTSRSAPEDDTFLNDLALETVTAQEATVINPTFSGLDNDGQPYEITANTAIQDPDNEDIVGLAGPRAVIRDGSAQTFATAKTGSFNSTDNILTLDQDVTLERTINGVTYVLRAPDATIAIDQETVTSTNGVTGTTKNSRLRADTMVVYNDQRRIVFTGNVRMKFDPKAIPRSAPPQSKDEAPAKVRPPE